MTHQDVADGLVTFERIGAACDDLRSLGLPEIADAVVRDARQSRGRIQSHIFPARRARELMDLADRTERLVTTMREAISISSSTVEHGGVKVFAETSDDEIYVGSFRDGVVVDRLASGEAVLRDIASERAIATRWINGFWTIDDRIVDRIYIQESRPEDAPGA